MNRLTTRELSAINGALSELLAGLGPQGVEDEEESLAIMKDARSAQEKVQAEIAKRERKSPKQKGGKRT